MKKYVIIMVVFASISIILCSCGNDQYAEDKAYRSILSNNLQGIREVIRDYPNIDLNDLKHHRQHYLGFGVKIDGRALSCAFDAVNDDSSDFSIAMELLKSGRINAYSEGKEGTYFDSAIETDDIRFCQEIFKNGGLPDKGIDYSIKYVRSEKGLDFLIDHGYVVDERRFLAAIEDTYQYANPQMFTTCITKKDDFSGKSRCLVAAINGDEEQLSYYVENEPEVITADVLFFAADTCSVKLLTHIAEAGFDFNIKDDDGWTPLHVAARHNTKEAVEFLIGQGLKSDGKADYYEYTLMDIAAMNGNVEVMEYLLKQGESFYSHVWESACRDETGKSIEYMLEHGYKVNDEDYYHAFVDSSKTVFDMAVKNFPTDIEWDDGIPIEDVWDEDRMLKLMDADAKITKDAFCTAVEYRYYKAVDAILEKAPNIDKTAPLFEAILNGDLELVKRLVENGADINKLAYDDMSEADETAVHVAAYSYSKDILKYLLDHGGKTSVKDGEGRTPYDLAKEYGNKENCKLLK